MFVSSLDEMKLLLAAAAAADPRLVVNIRVRTRMRAQRRSYFYSAEVDERLTEVKSPPPNPASARQSNQDAAKSVQSKYQRRVI